MLPLTDQAPSVPLTSSIRRITLVSKVVVWAGKSVSAAEYSAGWPT